MQPSSEDLWLAEVIDRRGTIGIHRHNTAGYYLRVTIGALEETAVRQVFTVAGVGVLRVERRSGPVRWRWTAACRNALRILNRIEPYVVRKKAQIQVAQEFYARGICRYRKGGLTAAQQRVRHACYVAMRALNAKDVSGVST